jgi:hypothetical protein
MAVSDGLANELATDVAVLSAIIIGAITFA